MGQRAKPATRFSDSRCAVALLLLVMTSLWFENDLSFLFGSVVQVTDRAVEDFSAGTTAAPAAFEVVGFTPDVNGWTLAPGRLGTLRYRIPNRRHRSVFIRAWIYSPTGLRNTVSVSTDGGATFALAKADVDWTDHLLDLGRFSNAPEELVVRVSAHNAGEHFALVIDKIDTFWYRQRVEARFVLANNSEPYQRLHRGDPPAMARTSVLLVGLGTALILLLTLRRYRPPHALIVVWIMTVATVVPLAYAFLGFTP